MWNYRNSMGESSSSTAVELQLTMKMNSGIIRSLCDICVKKMYVKNKSDV